MNLKPNSLLAKLSALAMATALADGQTTETPKLSATPCMDVLHLFTASNVPAFGPHEIEAPVNWKKTESPAGLPGKGLAQHPMLYVGENYDKMFLVNEGKVIWTYSTGTSYEYDDVWMLSNGNILYTRMEWIEMIEVSWISGPPTSRNHGHESEAPSALHRRIQSPGPRVA